jgi:hypothetical protein
MGCLGHRKKVVEESADQKWDYINLHDFKAKGCGPGFAYVWLWFLLIISVAVYGVDTFTAVNLLILDNWSSKIEPGIPFYISKWIFSVCILLSFVNLGFEAWRAIRVIKRGNVAASFLDPLAVRWESIRPGSGEGWKRFLVFAELTKDRKGGEYIALFTYFNLQAWIRVIICSGPRQVINAFTFRDVYNSKLSGSSSTVEGSIALFFDKIRALAVEDYQQAVILGAMAFTLVVWVFSVLFFIASVLFYVTFLCHWIPRGDGGLGGYCERKVNQRLKKIVTQKVNKALAKGQHERLKAEYNNAIKNGEKPPMERMATLPTLPNVGLAPAAVAPMTARSKDDALPEMPMLNRNETTTTLPAYSSRAGSPGGIEMNNMGPKRPVPSRSGTMTTTASGYSTRAPLLGSAADMGTGRPESPVPTVPDISMANVPPVGAGHSNMRMPSTRTPAPSRTLTGQRMDSYDRNDNFSRSTPAPRQYEAYAPDGHHSPAPSGTTYQGWGPSRGEDMSRLPPSRYPGMSASPAPYTSYNERPAPGPRYQPPRSATGQFPPRDMDYHQPQRTMTAPMPSRGPDVHQYDRSYPPQRAPQGWDYSQEYGQDPGRTGTPRNERGPGYGYDVESQRDYGY